MEVRNTIRNRYFSLLFSFAVCMLLVSCSSPALYVKTSEFAQDSAAISFKRVRNAIGSTGPSYTIVDLGDALDYNGRIVLNTSINPYKHYRDTGMQIRNIEYMSLKGEAIIGNAYVLLRAIREKRDRYAQIIGVTGTGSDMLTWRRSPGIMKLVVVSPHVEAACYLGEIAVEAGKSYLVEFDSDYGSFNVIVR